MTLSNQDIKVWQAFTNLKGTPTTDQVASHLSIPESEVSNSVSKIQSTSGALIKAPIGKTVIVKKPYTPPQKPSSPNTSSPTIKSDQLKKPKRSSHSTNPKSVKQRVLRFIADRNLKKTIPFRRCQSCNSKNPEVSIPDFSTPFQVNLLCKSCLQKEIKPPPPPVNLKTLGKSFKPSGRQAARTKLGRLVKRHKDELPSFHCKKCLKSEENTKLMRKILTPSKPFKFIPLCRKCEYEIRNTPSEPWPDELNLWDLLGVKIPEDLEKFASQAIAKIKMVTQKDPCCTVCSVSHKDQDLTLYHISDYEFYLSCKDCSEYAEEDILDGYAREKTATLF